MEWPWFRMAAEGDFNRLRHAPALSVREPLGGGYVRP